MTATAAASPATNHATSTHPSSLIPPSSTNPSASVKRHSRRSNPVAQPTNGDDHHHQQRDHDDPHDNYDDYDDGGGGDADDYHHHRQHNIHDGNDDYEPSPQHHLNGGDGGDGGGDHDDAAYEEHYPHGVVVTHQVHSESPHGSLYEALNRNGFRVPNTISDPYGSRTYGERRPGDTPPHDAGGGHMLAHSRSAGGVVDTDIYEMGPFDVDDCRLECLQGVEFLCRLSCECIGMQLRCDGEPHCGANEDEQDCTVSNEAIVETLLEECESSGRHTMCPRTFVCIATSWLCDGDDDCGDFSDETRCAGHLQCAADQFECTNGLCVPVEWRCDGDDDCKDGSDELNCTRAACKGEEFRCGDGNCVAASFRCDGGADCADATDELNCCELVFG